jgi:hypothetical protein
MEIINPRHTWEAQQELVNKINDAGGMQSYVESLPGWNDAFTLVNDPQICCMDEGIAVPGSFRAAGSMLGWSLADVHEFCQKAGVRSLTSHESCAASGGVYKHYLIEQGLDPEVGYLQEDSEAFTQMKTKQLVEDLNEKYCIDTDTKKYSYGGHIPLSEMDRPKSQHIARVIYYNGSVRAFSPVLEPSLPSGFVIDRAPTNAHNALAQVKIALSVAFGSHGWGDLINSNQDTSKLLVVVIGGRGNGGVNSEMLIDELHGLDADFNDKVVIQHCLEPVINA